MGATQRDRMQAAMQGWLIGLNDYPGWREWKRKQIRHTLYFDDPLLTSTEAPWDAFVFSEEIEKQHAIILQYLGLEESIDLLKECEFYFRRYPFRGLPVTRHSHITNVCEMYFGRFYEFKERLRKYLNAMKKVVPKQQLDVGAIVKLFDKAFDQELRARHSVQHHCRFEDIAIDRVYLTGCTSHGNDARRREHVTAYRKLANEWARRARRRGTALDEFLEVVAGVTLANCGFLQSAAAKAPSKRRAA